MRSRFPAVEPIDTDTDPSARSIDCSEDVVARVSSGTGAIDAFSWFIVALVCLRSELSGATFLEASITSVPAVPRLSSIELSELSIAIRKTASTRTTSSPAPIQIPSHLVSVSARSWLIVERDPPSSGSGPSMLTCPSPGSRRARTAAPGRG